MCLFCYFIYLYSYYYCYYLGKMTFYKTTLISINLIKGTVLGRALWGVNTFPIHNWLSDLWIWFVDIFKFGFSMVFHNKLWWRLQSLNKYFLKLIFWSPRHDPGCDMNELWLTSSIVWYSFMLHTFLVEWFIVYTHVVQRELLIRLISLMKISGL